MPKVSVIIPVYNTEKYLPKCLDSVCNQTLSDIEIICINDASTDNSLAILKEYAKKDNRIKLINFKENKGAAAARNTGIDEAQGEYIGFVDSDDFVDLDFYEKLYRTAIDFNADAAKGNYKNAQSGYIDLSLNEKIREDKNNFAFAYCSAIFRKKIISDNNIIFPLLRDMEDPVFTLQFSLLANKIVIVDTACINIVKRENSLTNSIPSLKQITEKIQGLKKIIEILNSSNIESASYVFICSFWIWQVYINSMMNKDCNVHKCVANKILELANIVKNNEFVYKELSKYSKEFSLALKNKNFERLCRGEFNTQKEEIFSLLRKNIMRGVVNA